MARERYTGFVAQGGDVGAGVTEAMSRQAPEGLIGVHTNLLVPALNNPAALLADTEPEKPRSPRSDVPDEWQRLLRAAVHHVDSDADVEAIPREPPIAG